MYIFLQVERMKSTKKGRKLLSKMETQQRNAPQPGQSKPLMITPYRHNWVMSGRH